MGRARTCDVAERGRGTAGRFDRIRSAMGSADVTAQMIGRLRAAGPVLIALDNAEHVVDGVAGLVDRVVTECPNVTVLVTSREQLGLPGEMVWVVPPLSAPEPGAPISLADLDRFDATCGRSSSARAARAATWSSTRSPRSRSPRSAAGSMDFLWRLSSPPLTRDRCQSSELPRVSTRRLRLLSQGSRTTLARHQTLHASIARSVDLLDENRDDCAVVPHRVPVAVLLDGAVEVATDGGNVDALGDPSVGPARRQKPPSVRRGEQPVPDARDRSAVLRSASARHAGARSSQGTARGLPSPVRCTAVGEGRYGVEREQFVRVCPT